MIDLSLHPQTIILVVDGREDLPDEPRPTENNRQEHDERPIGLSRRTALNELLRVGEIVRNRPCVLFGLASSASVANYRRRNAKHSQEPPK